MPFNRYSRTITGSDWGWSYGDEGTERGTVVKAWLISPDDANPEQVRVYTVIQNLWGNQMMQDFHDNQWYFVLENGLWAGVHKNRTYTGTIFAGTAYGWALMQSMNGIGDIGDALINKYTNNALPNSSKLQFAQTGLAQPTGSGKLSNSEIMSAGYGCIIVWAEEAGGGNGGDGGNTTHTWDSSTFPHIEGEPPTPPPTETDPTKKVYTIIKSYRLKNNGVYEDKGTFVRTSTVASIS